MLSEEKIRKQLSEALLKEPNNYTKILSLSNQLVAFDKNHARFTVDAGVIDRLGRELVGRKETAVSELIKNSYDADASLVDLIFENSDVEEGNLRIVDNGLGMTKEELLSGFMRISSTDKIHNPQSPIYGRSRAGKKGIGRFAVQRLGRSLTIVTRKKGERVGAKVKIDWSQYQSDVDLYAIANTIVEIPVDFIGTELIIEGLREKWTRKEIERIYRYIAALIQPYPLSKQRLLEENKRKEKLNDPGFKANLYKLEGGIRQLIANEETEIYRYAVAVIRGNVDSQGKSTYSVLSERLDIDDRNILLGAKKDKPKQLYKTLRNVNLEAHYFLYLDEFIPPQQRSKIIEMAQHSGGIRLYRNGFRVLPYGEPFNDWLKLDESEKKRIILPRHGNTNFFGFVEIIDPQGNLFEETSSREGLLETDGLAELQDFAYRVLTSAIIRIAHERSIKVTTSQKGWLKKFDRGTDRLKYVKEEIKKIAETVSLEAASIEKDKLSKDDIIERLTSKTSSIRNIEQSLSNLIKEQENEEELQIQETSVLRVLASLGLSIGMFAHEVRQYLASIEASFMLLKKKYPDDNNYQSRIQRLHENVRLLKTYTSYFDRTVSENINRELAPQDLDAVVEKFVDTVSHDKKSKKVDIRTEFSETDLVTIPMHYSEWATIFFNLYTNSIKAIKRAGAKGKILISVKSEGNFIVLEFIDNGDGIPEENWERIFEPFFTTSTTAGHFAEEQDEILGTGLGMKIVKDIIVAYGGNIEVVSPRESYSTCIRIEIPKAKI